MADWKDSEIKTGERLRTETGGGRLRNGEETPEISGMVLGQRREQKCAIIFWSLDRLTVWPKGRDID